MPNVPTFIKPSRTMDEVQPLSQAVTILNSLRGVETSVVLDLNILNMMRSVMSGDSTLDEENLSGLVDFFNSNLVCITPGFAFREADKEYVAGLRADYEKFMSWYCPGYIDTPNCTHDFGKRARSREFKRLGRGDRYTLVIMYTAMLAIQVISKEPQGASPEQKFSAYLDFMRTDADMVSAIEAEVAKYFFFDRTRVRDESFRSRCKIIRDNFNKGGKGRGRLQYTLNYARDLAYYRFTALQDGKPLDGVVQDCWLVTADQALIEIAKSIYFYPCEGEAAKFVALARNEEQERSDYWTYCDELFQSAVVRRQRSGKSLARMTKKSWKKLFSSQRRLENKVLEYWPAEENV
ncbi:hypothetical protein HOP51_04145 [Halomonas sp. MCCC 1A11036]|uniref:Uncharacterized protein n=1 Tax=Billgrantia zhangzhouensis TaxID=2733481 RepID=A0ABS9ABP4_9GAMM|nr:hypothetical protein [Halomonas zhangzhouensis]MCE8019313.1 hypothetical protein [Halomonas zhangzhouensis]